MNYHLNYLLPIYMVLYFLFLMIFRAIQVGKTIGKNQIVLSNTDDPHGLIARYFSAWMAALCIYIVILTVYPVGYNWFLPITHLENDWEKITGLVLLAISLVWTYIAQGNMRNSWRVGIDQQQKTELITSGIFKYSRNPIYLGMMLSALGLFLVTPTGFTLTLTILGFVLIQIQIRLEEEFLYKMHGQLFLDYRNKTRRFI